jgi:hypothetical protein
MNAAGAVAHRPPLPADTPLDHARSASEILNAESALLLTRHVGMPHATPLGRDDLGDHDPCPAGCSAAWLYDDLDVAPQ